MTTQTTYAATQGIGFPGQIASEIPRTVITRQVGRLASLSGSVPTPPIAFGVAVSQGPNDRDVLAGGTLANFIGVSVKDITLEIAQGDSYAGHQNIGVLLKGEIFVKPTADVLANGGVFFDAATGAFGTSGSGPIVGAHYVTAGKAGTIVAIRLT
jgi:hypothetical protein